MLYYDIWDDPAGIGIDRHLMKAGDIFQYDGKDWAIIEVNFTDGIFLIEEIIADD